MARTDADKCLSSQMNSEVGSAACLGCCSSHRDGCGIRRPSKCSLSDVLTIWKIGPQRKDAVKCMPRRKKNAYALRSGIARRDGDGPIVIALES